MNERKLVLLALMAAFALQFGWVFVLQHSCLSGVQNRGGEAAQQLCTIASERFSSVSRSAQDIFLSLLVPVSAAAAAAAARRGGRPGSQPPEDRDPGGTP